MKRLKFFLLLVSCTFVFTGFTWPGEKTQKSSPQTEAASKKTEAVHEESVSRGSDLMEGVVTSLDLEAEPAVITVQFTSGQKANVEIARNTTVFRKDQVLGAKELAVGNRLRVEYVMTGVAKVAKNIEIVEVATPVKIIAAQVLESVDKKSAKPEPRGKKLVELELVEKKLDE